MGSILLKFATSKMGVTVLVLLALGIQQLRINSYQSDVKILEKEKQVLNVSLEMKETEALGLESAIQSQNKKVAQLKTAALASQKEREGQFLSLKFKHMADYKKLNNGEGPGDLNSWLKKYLK